MDKKPDFTPELIALVTPLADRVSYFLKTDYRDVPRENFPFDLAFMRAMDLSVIIGVDRVTLKRVVGHILRARPRKKVQKESGDTTTRPTVTPPTMTFVTERACRNLVILCSTMMGDKLVYGRNPLGEVVQTATQGHPPQVAMMHGLERAKEIFAEMDRDAVRDSSIEIKSPSDDIVLLVIGAKWKLVACRSGNGNIRTLLSDVASGRPMKQTQVPHKLMQEARAVAKQYFKDTRTGDLFR